MKALAILLLLAAPAFAHRLDEYLEATTIELQAGRVLVHLRLTPGVAVAPQVLAAIDTDGDGALSPAEQLAYTGHVIADLALTVDGRAAPLQLVSSAFPSVAAIAGGVGLIDLELAADVPADVTELSFENHHAPAPAVYLANCLVPRDPAIRVLRQQRSRDQAIFRVTLANRSRALRRGYVCFGLAAFGGLFAILLSRSRRSVRIADNASDKRSTRRRESRSAR